MLSSQSLILGAHFPAGMVRHASDQVRLHYRGPGESFDPTLLKDSYLDIPVGEDRHVNVSVGLRYMGRPGVPVQRHLMVAVNHDLFSTGHPGGFAAMETVYGEKAVSYLGYGGEALFSGVSRDGQRLVDVKACNHTSGFLNRMIRDDMPRVCNDMEFFQMFLDRLRPEVVTDFPTRYIPYDKDRQGGNHLHPLLSSSHSNIRHLAHSAKESLGLMREATNQRLILDRHKLESFIYGLRKPSTRKNMGEVIDDVLTLLEVYEERFPEGAIRWQPLKNELQQIRNFVLTRYDVAEAYFSLLETDVGADKDREQSVHLLQKDLYAFLNQCIELAKRPSPRGVDLFVFPG